MLALLIHVFMAIPILGKNAPNYTFNEDFIIGAATSAYQVEGAWNVDGKGPSVWDVYTHQHPDGIADRSNGDDAAKSYYKYKKDVQALKDMKMEIYRFSISWPRVMPTGLANNISKEGTDYYMNLIDELKRNRIEPMVTMHHWDVPQYLQELGGWACDRMVKYFEEYARFLFETYGDKVKWWVTINEPNMFVKAYEGLLASTSGVGPYLVMHTILKAHAAAYHLYQNEFREQQKGKISIAIAFQWWSPLKNNSDSDREAAEQGLQFENGWVGHPIYSKDGDYPQVMKDRIDNLSRSQGFSESRLPKFTDEEIQYIQGTADFFAMNEYSGHLATPGESGSVPSITNDIGVQRITPDSWPVSNTSKWEAISPKSIRDSSKWIRKNYGQDLQIFITENGFSDSGQLNDTGRMKYLATYMMELWKAKYIDHCNVIGYTVWSLIDNFEWISGYTPKFGLYYVNFSDPERTRTPKQSSFLMKEIIETRKIPKKYIPVDEDLNSLEHLTFVSK